MPKIQVKVQNIDDEIPDDPVQAIKDFEVDEKNFDLSDILLELDTQNTLFQTSPQPQTISTHDLSSSEPKEPIKIDSFRIKKTKSTLPDVGKMKSELKEENERLRQKPIQKQTIDEQLHIGFLFSSPLVLRVQQGSRE